MDATQSSLVIRGENVQRAYSWYSQQQLTANRRYQRKLVWSMDEKASFVDSILRGYPVPLFLLAETKQPDKTTYEIIDGMQRLNAMFSFLENEFPINGCYFDLDSIPETRIKLKSKILKQKTPRLDEISCSRISSYTLPLSIYADQTDNDIDEIFRRVNSGGKKLSRQELRHAGATGNFAQLVRRIASRVRGDVSAKDRLPLNNMREISITSTDLEYGIDVNSIFWVKQGVLTRDYVRQSRDEELVSDLLGYMLLDPRPPSNSEVLDQYFGIAESEEEKSRFNQVETAVQKFGAEAIENRFLAAHDALSQTLDAAKKPFYQLMSQDAAPRMPRYYQIVFLAFDQLMSSGLRPADYSKTAAALSGLAKVGKNKQPRLKITEGGSWSGTERADLTAVVVGKVQRTFAKSEHSDPGNFQSKTVFENLLMQSKTENALYDFKQGTHRLDGSKTPDLEVFSQLGETIAAIANHEPDTTGYVVFGVSDKKSTADQIHKFYGVTAVPKSGFFITGIDHEAKPPNSLDRYFQQFIERIRSLPLTPAVRDQVCRDTQTVTYHDKTMILVRIRSQSEPTTFRDSYFERHGSNNTEVKGEALKRLFQRFKS